MRFGFIGAGNMGGAIYKGFIKNNAVPRENIYIYDIQQEKIEEEARKYKINPTSSYSELISNVDCVILAVKPNVFDSVISEISHLLKQYNSTVISIAAGLSIDKIINMIGFKIPLIRIMPNINAEICMSTTAYCYNNKVSEMVVSEIVKAFRSIGYITHVEEKDFPIFTAIASCSPAYVYLFIDSLAKGALKAGLNKQKAVEIAASAVMGSANNLIQSGVHPQELMDRVCSPGGTTIEGVCTLNELNFEHALVKAVENSIIKDATLNKKSN